ncbi:hypothetical protein SAMN05421811_104199 [Nonomuraea wenchangensis]|uniref:Uncharacterized protein n=1 Tax=Nonomuraea wenchangensis TaxID=568860 RepID=A0A1I0HC08_9ACTN|nr:hypothetical protein SAMN05421811_104199 [Nonomuraea wenchangensis]
MRHPGKLLALFAGAAVIAMIMRELPAIKRYITMTRM